MHGSAHDGARGNRSVTAGERNLIPCHVGIGALPLARVSRSFAVSADTEFPQLVESRIAARAWSQHAQFGEQLSHTRWHDCVSPNNSPEPPASKPTLNRPTPHRHAPGRAAAPRRHQPRPRERQPPRHQGSNKRPDGVPVPCPIGR